MLSIFIWGYLCKCIRFDAYRCRSHIRHTSNKAYCVLCRIFGFKSLFGLSDVINVLFITLLQWPFLHCLGFDFFFFLFSSCSIVGISCCLCLICKWEDGWITFCVTPAFLLPNLSSLAGICCYSCCSCVHEEYLCVIRQKKNWTAIVSACIADLSVYCVGLIVVEMRSMWHWGELGLCNGLSVLQKSGRCVAQLEAGLSFCFWG